MCPEFLLPYFDDTFIASDVKRLSHDGLSSEQLREVWEALAIPERIADASGVDSREALIQFASIVAPEFLRRQNMNLDDITTSVADSLFPGLRSICPLADETLQRVRLAFLCNEDPIAEISSTVNGIDSIHLVASNAFGRMPTSWTTRGFEGMMHLMRFPNIDNACKQSIYDIVAGRLVITVHRIIGLTPIQAVLAITDPEPLCEFESKSDSVTALYMAWICRHPPVRLCPILREDGVDVASFVDRLFTSPEASLDSWVEEITETGLLEMIPRATEDCKQVLMEYIISVLVGRRTQKDSSTGCQRGELFASRMQLFCMQFWTVDVCSYVRIFSSSSCGSRRLWTSLVPSSPLCAMTGTPHACLNGCNIVCEFSVLFCRF